MGKSQNYEGARFRERRTKHVDDTPHIVHKTPLKIVFINGPPRSGKDTLAGLLMRSIGRGRVYKFTTPMDIAIKSTFNIGHDTWLRMREADKDVRQPCFNHMTLREVMIDFSEQFMKPNFGPMIFGHLAVEHLRDAQGNSQAVFISDSGFVDEALPVAVYFGWNNCVQLILEREGCSFEGDSRSIWQHDKIKQIKISNNHTPRHLQTMATFELTRALKLVTVPKYELIWE